MPKKVTRALVASVLLAATLTAVSPSRAEYYYPWCVQYGGGWEGINATSCGFVSYEQCMATARGTGASCIENPADPRPSPRAMKPRHPQRKSL
jgi:Protein of unknown function (DUF3551)